MIERIDNSQIQDILKESSSKQINPSKFPANNEVDDSWQVNYDSLIKEAKQIPTEDTTAVQRAQELLSSGRLDTPENSRAAAENIITFGI